MSSTEATGLTRLPRYALGIAGAAAAVLLRWALQPVLHDKLPLFTIYVAVLATARYCGMGPSIVVSVAGAAGAVAVTGERDPIRLLGYVVLCSISIWIIEVLRRANLKAERNAQLAEERLCQLREESARRAREGEVSAQARAVVDSSADAIVSRSLDGAVRTWNFGAEQIFGYSAAEAIGSPVSLLVPNLQLPEEAGILERIRQGGRVAHFETVRQRKDGRQIHVSVTISPIRDASGLITGISDISRDITERKMLEEHLRQTQKLESLGVLAGGLAHDFNNLLTGIMGNASLAMYDLSDPEGARNRMQEVLHASERAALLVGQMLAYAGKGKYIVERMDLSVEVEETVPLVRTASGHPLELDLQPSLPTVEGDRSQIRQVVMNLALNALESIGNRAGTIAIRTYSRELDGARQVVLEVRDTGCGMDADTRARIFDPFFTTKFTGRGLGLAAVLGIVQAHHGSISVESTPGAGSTFTVVLPAASPSPAASAVPEPAGDLRGYGTVLVVDDEELVRNMARLTLERYGYHAELAANGRSAVELFALRPDEFDVILLDLKMPLMDGEEALRNIQQIRPGVPIVLSSGFSEGEALHRFRNSGLSGFLQKPYTATALARKVKQAIRRYSVEM